MDSRQAQKLFFQHASAMAYISVQTEDGSNQIGSAFHVGDGIFVTARHILQGNRIIEIRVTEPVRISTEEYFREVLKLAEWEKRAREHEEAFGQGLKSPMMFKHWIEPLEISDGPFFDEETDVAVFRVSKLHPAVDVVKLGVHWDDWVIRGRWHLSDAIVLGYPPVPMSNQPLLLAARAEVHTFLVPRHSNAIHFILSTVPRGGFSGGVAIHESGDALGVITSSFVNDNLPEQLGFFAVLSIEAIVNCLAANGLYSETQRKYHEELLQFDPMKLFEGMKKNTS